MKTTTKCIRLVCLGVVGMSVNLLPGQSATPEVAKLSGWSFAALPAWQEPQATTGTITQVVFSFEIGPLAMVGARTTKVTRVDPNELVQYELVGGCGCGPARACCRQFYQLGATATDSEANSATTTISVQADSIPPVVTFAPLTHGETVTNLAAIGGNVTDNFDLVASVVFSVELDVNGGPGRWWNGTNFQSDSVALPATVSTNALRRASRFRR